MGLSQDAAATILVAVMGMAIGWGSWVSVSIFKHAQEIALLKQEIALLKQHIKLQSEEIVVLNKVKEVLDGIRTRLDRD